MLTFLTGVSMEFIDWLNNELNKRGWTQADLARQSGITTAGISRIMTGERKPGKDICTAIADALRYPPETIFRIARLLPNKPEFEIEMDEWRFILAKLSERDRAELMEIARGKLERTNETWNEFIDNIQKLPKEERDRILKDQAEIIKETLYKIGARRDK